VGRGATGRMPGDDRRRSAAGRFAGAMAPGSRALVGADCAPGSVGRCRRSATGVGDTWHCDCGVGIDRFFFDWREALRARTSIKQPSSTSFERGSKRLGPQAIPTGPTAALFDADRRWNRSGRSPTG
jgi:hypothetical protein